MNLDQLFAELERLLVAGETTVALELVRRQILADSSIERCNQLKELLASLDITVRIQNILMRELIHDRKRTFVWIVKHWDSVNFRNLQEIPDEVFLEIPLIAKPSLRSIRIALQKKIDEESSL